MYIARAINSIEGGTMEEREREREIQTFTTFAGKRSNPSDVFLEGEVTDGRMIDLAQGDLGWIDWNSTVDGNFPSFFFNLLRPIR